jgi:hypothetical protein
MQSCGSSPQKGEKATWDQEDYKHRKKHQEKVGIDMLYTINGMLKVKTKEKAGSSGLVCYVKNSEYSARLLSSCHVKGTHQVKNAAVSKGHSWFKD